MAGRISGGDLRAVATIGVMGLLASGCATRPVTSVSVAPPPVVVAARPTLPAGVPERLTVPVRDVDGRYRTINFALTPDQMVWHVRSALNVAVLACRGPGETVIAADYNALLRAQKAGLAAAYARVQAGFRSGGGKDWQTAQDAQSTRVYNFFALPPAKPGFCAAATQVLTESRTVTPDGFAAFAATALVRLEQPFTDVYRAYDDYRRDLAAWESAQAGRVMTAQAAAPRPATAAPKLDYVGLDTLIDWQPRADQQMAGR